MASFDELIERLAGFYGPLRMPPDDPFGYYVWEVLGTRTSAGRRDAAMTALRRVPALTPDAVGKLARGRLEAVVRQCGSLIEERMAALEAGATVFRRQPRLVERLRGPLRQAWLAARDLPHLGHAGALGVLLFAGSGRLAPVDEGLTRFATRFGLAPPLANRRRLVRDVRGQLTTRLPADAAARRKAVLYLQHHADHTCVAGVPHCNACPLADACAEGRSWRAGRSAIGSM